MAINSYLARTGWNVSRRRAARTSTIRLTGVVTVTKRTIRASRHHRPAAEPKNGSLTPRYAGNTERCA